MINLTTKLFRVATSRRVPLRDAIEKRPPPDEPLEDFDEPVEDTNELEEERVPASYYPVVPPFVISPGFPNLFLNKIWMQNFYVPVPQRAFYSPLQFYKNNFTHHRERSLFYPSSPYFLSK